MVLVDLEGVQSGRKINIYIGLSKIISFYFRAKKYPRTFAEDIFRKSFHALFQNGLCSIPSPLRDIFLSTR